MNRYISALFCSLLAASCACAQQENPTVDGYVTRAASGTDFDVNGLRVICRETTSIRLLKPIWGSSAVQGCPLISLYVGEPMTIFGIKNEYAHTVDAKRIDLAQASLHAISGSAVIDALPSQDTAGPPAQGLLIRADGYRIRIGPKTKIEWTGSLHALSDVKAGDWIEYKGKENADGAVSAASVKLAPIAVSQGEQKLREKSDFDPAAVPPSARQGAVSAVFTGINPKRFPPYDDPAMQARVTAIGKKLIPAYQRDLPESDPAKIQFRFQLVDTGIFRDALTQPSGVILVPRQVVERMQNDSQLAAVLADGIASALERQRYRAIPPSRTVAAELVGTQVAGLFVPALGSAGVVAGVRGVEAIRTRAEEQRGRVSLALLHDAGYDIDQAPLAWWLLAAGKSTPLQDISLPDRADYLYRILGQNWHNPAAPTKP